MSTDHHALYNTLSLIKLFGACLVMTTHLGQQYWGISFYSFGTGCFFVVSGFYALNWRREHGWRYLRSRLIRLCPAFFFAVLLYGLSRPVPFDTLAEVLFHHATFFLAASSRDQVFSLNPAFWSLPVFVTFFILVSLLPRTFTPRWRHLSLLLPLPLIAHYAQLEQWRSGYLLLWAAPFYLYAFWLGALCKHADTRQRPGADISVMMLAVILVLCGAHFSRLSVWLPQGNGIGWQLMMVPLYTLLLWMLLHSRITRRPHPWLSKLGELSFGLYLFHNLPGLWLPDTWPPAVLTLVTLALTLILATASRHWIERPLIHLVRHYHGCHMPLPLLTPHTTARQVSGLGQTRLCLPWLRGKKALQFKTGPQYH